MSRFFGSKKDEVPPPSLGDVSTTLGQRIQQLDQKIAHLDNQLLQCRSQMEQAKSAPMKDRVRKRAGQLLRERKMYENQREQLAGSQWNVEQTDFNIQMAKDTTTQMEALRSAQTTMKEQMKAMNLTDVYAMQDEMEDMFDMQNEIQEVMARSFAVPEDIDDADLDAELDMLASEMPAFETEPSYASAASYPTAPQSSGVAVDEYGLPISNTQSAGPVSIGF